MIYERAPGKLVDGFPHRFKRAEFAELEAFLHGFDVMPLRDLARNPGVSVADSNAIHMRHDVDHNIDHALKFARWEADRGMSSSYFVLPTAWYYKPRDREFELKLLELRDLGHEVGLHVNYLEVLDDGPDPGFERSAEWLRDELGYLRTVAPHIDVTGLNASEREYVDGEPLEVVGCAAHGDERRHTYNISNLDIWAYAGGPFNPPDFELEYEAYHLNAGATYISDNGGTWRSPVENDDHSPTVMLVHPCHWDIDAELATFYQGDRCSVCGYWYWDRPADQVGWHSLVPINYADTPDLANVVEWCGKCEVEK